jgi:hypothetical protein
MAARCSENKLSPRQVILVRVGRDPSHIAHRPPWSVAALCIEQQEERQLELKASGLDELGQYGAMRVVSRQDEEPGTDDYRVRLEAGHYRVRLEAGRHVPFPATVLPQLLKVRLNGLGQWA